jgi:hypothetical protein
VIEMEGPGFVLNGALTVGALVVLVLNEQGTDLVLAVLKGKDAEVRLWLHDGKVRQTMGSSESGE